MPPTPTPIPIYILIIDDNEEYCNGLNRFYTFGVNKGKVYD